MIKRLYVELDGEKELSVPAHKITSKKLEFLLARINHEVTYPFERGYLWRFIHTISYHRNKFTGAPSGFCFSHLSGPVDKFTTAVKVSLVRDTLSFTWETVVGHDYRVKIYDSFTSEVLFQEKF